MTPRWLLSSGFAFALLCSATPAFAATKYWIGSPGGSFTSNSNWSTTSGGGNDTTAPGSSDIATFDGGGNTNATISSTVNVAGIDIKSTYTQTITQNAGITITVGSSNWSQYGGTFSGGNSAITVSGTLTLSGSSVFTSTTGILQIGITNDLNVTRFNFTSGTFNASSGTFNFRGTWILGSSATFNAGSGTVVAFDRDQQISPTTTLSLNNLTINSFNGPRFAVNSASVIVNGTLMMTDGGIASGTVNAKGPISIAATFDGGAGMLQINGAGNQSFSVPNGAILPKLTLNNVNTIVTMLGNATVNSDTITLSDSLIIQAGTFTSSSTGTLTIYGGYNRSGGMFNPQNGTVQIRQRTASLTVPGTETFNNLDVACYSPGSCSSGHSLTIAGGTVIVLGKMTFTDGAVNGGSISAKGNIAIASGFDGGSTSLILAGTGTQIIDIKNGGTATGGTWKIQKPSGVASLSGALVLNTTNQDLEIGSGTLNLNNNNLILNRTLTVKPTGILQLRGGETVTATTKTLNTDSKVIYTGTGTFSSFPLGNSYSNLSFSGSGIWNIGSALSVGKALSFSGGTLNANGNTVSVTGLTTLRNGTYQASTAKQTLSGGLLVSGGTFTGSSGPVTLSGSLTLSSGMLTAPAGTLSLWGDWVKTGGTFACYGGTVAFTGGRSQSLNAGGTDVGSSFTTLTVAKSTGTLSLTTNALSGATLNVTGGTFAPGSQNITTTALTVNGGTLTRGAGTLTTRTLTVLSGTYNANTQTTTIPGLTQVSGGTYLASTAKQTLSGGLTINGGTFTGSSGPVSLSGSLTLSSGVLSAPSGTLSIAGDWTKAGGTFTSNGGTVAFTGNRSQALTSGGTDSASDFSILSVVKPSGTLSLATNDLSGSLLTLTSGTFSPGALSVSLGSLTQDGGTFGAATSLTLHGDLTLNGGTFTPPPSGILTLAGNVTVSAAATLANATSTALVLNGTDQTLSGTLILSSLTKSAATDQILSFTPGTRVYTAEALSLNGSANGSLTLQSTVGGRPWQIQSYQRRSLSHIIVRDSTNIDNLMACRDHCTDGGGNTNWLFIADAVPTTSTGGGGEGGGGGGGHRTATATVSPTSSASSATSSKAQAASISCQSIRPAVASACKRLESRIASHIAKSPSAAQALQAMFQRFLKRVGSSR
jgi:hypothetical protein